MSSLAAGNVRRIVSNPEDIRDPGDVLILTDDRPSPVNAVVYRALYPGDIGSLVAGLYGNPISALQLLTTPWNLDGLPVDRQQEALDAVRAVAQQWGNSTIDGAHGIHNLLANAEHLLPSSRVDSALTNHPVVAVGAGPSTEAMIDDLRSCGLPIIAADGALAPLLAAGIPVAACTPLERLRSTGQKIPADCQDVMFAGSPFVPNRAVTPFKRHTFWPTCDPVFDWYEAPDSEFHPGTTSGTCAIAVALRLTNGPVYLVGHDLCDGHMSGTTVSHSLSDPFDAYRLGYNATLLPTKTAWLRAKYDIESMKTNRIINAAGHRGYGLRLDGVRTDNLPTQEPIIIHWPTARFPKRLTSFREKSLHLKEDIQSLAIKAQSAQSLFDCHLESLAEKRNLDPIAYILRPLYAQCSILRRLGREEADVVTIFKQAVENITHTISGAIHG